VRVSAPFRALHGGRDEGGEVSEGGSVCVQCVRGVVLKRLDHSEPK
jgi:hypothetical protein